MFDDVNGQIVGGMDFVRVALVAPNGRIQKEATISDSADPSDWASEQKQQLLSAPCGNGKQLSDYPEIYNGIYGKGSWSVRIYER